MSAHSTTELIGTFWPDDSETVFNNAECGAVVVHDIAVFNDCPMHGAIQICGCDDWDMSMSDIDTDAGLAPDWLNAAGARQLAALLIKAADRADAIAKAKETQA